MRLPYHNWLAMASSGWKAFVTCHLSSSILEFCGASSPVRTGVLVHFLASPGSRLLVFSSVGHSLLIHKDTLALAALEVSADVSVSPSTAACTTADCQRYSREELALLNMGNLMTLTWITAIIHWSEGNTIIRF